MKSRNPSAARRASLPVATVVLAVAAGAGTPAAAASAPRVACMPRTAYVGSEYRTVAAQDTAVTPINTCTNKAGPAIPLGEGWAPPSAIAITPNGATAYLLGVNQVGAGMVTPIRTRTNKAGRAIPVGADPRAIAITPNGATAYVVNASSDTVTPIRTRTNKAGRAIPVGADPRAIAITPNGATAYVVNASSDTVTPISTRTNKAGPAIPVGPDPGVIAIMTGNRLPVPSRTRPRRITTAPPGSTRRGWHPPSATRRPSWSGSAPRDDPGSNGNRRLAGP
jgi:YVTN family beta-propeller protein